MAAAVAASIFRGVDEGAEGDVVVQEEVEVDEFEVEDDVVTDRLGDGLLCSSLRGLRVAATSFVCVSVGRVLIGAVLRMVDLVDDFVFFDLLCRLRFDFVKACLACLVFSSHVSSTKSMLLFASSGVKSTKSLV